MKFNLHVAKYFYTDEKVMAKLKDLGYTFELYKGNGEMMVRGNPTIDIKDLDELIAFSNEWGVSLVVDSEDITIYNDYLE